LLAAPGSKISVSDLEEVLGVARRTAAQMRRTIRRLLDAPVVRRVRDSAHKGAAAAPQKAVAMPPAATRIPAEAIRSRTNTREDFKLVSVEPNVTASRRRRRGSRKRAKSQVVQLSLELDR
jgi:hypothetical protein